MTAGLRAKVSPGRPLHGGQLAGVPGSSLCCAWLCLAQVCPGQGKAQA